MRRIHLSDDALQMARRRIVAGALLAWFPLLLLSTLTGEFWGGQAAVPFLKDAEVHVRFLVALPLLILAELVVHQRMRPLVQQFLERNLMPENRPSSIRGCHCLGRAPAQFGGRRGGFDRLGLWVRHRRRLALFPHA
jgi:hypothetical protein